MPYTLKTPDISVLHNNNNNNSDNNNDNNKLWKESWLDVMIIMNNVKEVCHTEQKICQLHKMLGTVRHIYK